MIGVSPNLLFVCILSLMLAGCRSYTGDFSVKTEEELVQMERDASSARGWFQNGNYDSADHVFSRLGSEKTVSQPLYKLDRVPVLLLAGRKDDAHDLLMNVREELETLYDSELEERAQSIWHGEANKVYKGDAHEQSTLYALLALSFIDRGQCEDALRSVKNGLLADCFGSNDAYNADYGLLHYLGWVCALRCGEKDVADRYRDAMMESFKAQGIKIDHGNLVSEDAGNPNALVVVWSGTPPSYSRGGEYGEKRMVLSGGKSQFDFVTVEDASGRELVVPAGLGDINFQATTRGGRLMDNVLKDKADVKENFKTAAKTSLVLSGWCFTLGNSLLSSNEYLALASLCCYGVGACCLVFDVAFMWAYDDVDATADTRSWQTLPGQLNVLPLQLAAGCRQLKIRGYIAGDVMMEKSVEVEVHDDGRIAVVHVPCMGGAALGDAIKLFNTTAGIAHGKAPVDPALNNSPLSGEYDTSASYSIIGTDRLGSQLVMNDAALAMAIAAAMEEHGYHRHYRAESVLAGTQCPKPDLVVGAMDEHFQVRSVAGRRVLDTRVAVMVRRPGVLADGKFDSGKVRFFYAWSRLPTSEPYDKLTATTKSNGRKAALDNLFNVHEFRVAISKSGALIPTPLTETRQPPYGAERSEAAHVQGADNSFRVSAYEVKDLLGRWESSYQMDTVSVVAGREIRTSTPSVETLVLNHDNTFARIQLANGRRREFSGIWSFKSGELTIGMTAPDGGGGRFVSYRILPRTSECFELRFSNLDAYEAEINSDGKRLASAKYLEDGTLTTKITIVVPNQDPAVTTISQQAKIFSRVNAENSDGKER